MALPVNGSAIVYAWRGKPRLPTSTQCLPDVILHRSFTRPSTAWGDRRLGNEARQEELGVNKPYNRLPCSCFLPTIVLPRNTKERGFLIASVLTFLNLGLYKVHTNPSLHGQISGTKGASTAKALVIQHFECDEAIGCLDYDSFVFLINAHHAHTWAQWLVFWVKKENVLLRVGISTTGNIMGGRDINDDQTIIWPCYSSARSGHRQMSKGQL